MLTLAGVRVTRAARRDITALLIASATGFGSDARRRYEALLLAGLETLLVDAAPTGSRERPDLGDRVQVWHLRFVRRPHSGQVRTPRHVADLSIER